MERHSIGAVDTVRSVGSLASASMAGPGYAVEYEVVKILLRLFIAFIVVLMLPGCYVHKGRLCSITMPQIYCDEELYQRATNPSPLINDWFKSGVAEGGRLRDWVECGGSKNGWYYPDSSPEDSIYEYQKLSRAKHHQIQSCMLRKGYRYVGPCDTPTRKAWPGCVASQDKTD